MSDAEDDATQTSREEDVLTYELYFWIVRQMNEKGVIKIGDLRKLYTTVVAKDRSVQIRPLQELLQLVNANLAHWQGWRAVQQEDRITYVNMEKEKEFGLAKPSETERTLGLLELTLMYIFVAIKPSSKNPGVTQDELMAYLERTMSTQADHKLSQSQQDVLKKLISPNARSDFMKKGYLTFTKAVENDEEVFRYDWGPTAQQTIDAVQLVKTFQKLTGMDATQLIDQMKRANELKAIQMEAVKNAASVLKRGQK